MLLLPSLILSTNTFNEQADTCSPTLLNMIWIDKRTKIEKYAPNNLFNEMSITDWLCPIEEHQKRTFPFLIGVPMMDGLVYFL